MATIVNNLLRFSNFLSKGTNLTAFGSSTNYQQVRNKFLGRWMIRDIKRRKIAEEFGPVRLRLVAMKRNNILPREIIEAVGQQIDETIPRQSAKKQLTTRCVITSRPRGVVHRWRLSRIVFRDLADYNKLAGVQRAMW
ncbi:mitochondrial ribosomal protein S14 [Colletes latitarsis]|uniref:mitochondrial ribosomal protein S14 n=1 Tax=Colletes latitarsis TaxID=2605962 RepID=UPI004035F4B9